MEKAKQILDVLSFSTKLKKQERTIKLSNTRHESVADHSWHLALMVVLVQPLLKKKVNLLKCLKMALIHDLVEAEIGDIGHGYKALDKKIKIKNQHAEQKEILKIKKIIGGDLGKELFKLWHEFEKNKTKEAKFLKALDSLEADFQALLFDVSYWDDWFYKVAWAKGNDLCKHEKILDDLNKQLKIKMKKEFKKAGVDVSKF